MEMTAGVAFLIVVVAPGKLFFFVFAIKVVLRQGQFLSASSVGVGRHDCCCFGGGAGARSGVVCRLVVVAVAMISLSLTSW